MRVPVALFLLASVLAASQPVHAEGGAYGVAPTDLTFGQAIREEPIYQTISIQNSKDEPVRLEFVALDEAGAWALPTAENVTLAARSTLDLPLRMVVPSDVPNGNYAGALHVRFLPDSSIAEGTSGAAIAFAVRVNLTVDVGGDQVEKLEAGGLFVPDIEEGGPPYFYWHVRNAGNVRATPTALVTIERPSGEIVARENATGVVVPPGLVENVTFRLTTSLPRGQYIATAVLAPPGEETPQTAWFEVLEAGSLRRSGTLGPLAFTDAGTRAQTHRIPFGHAVEFGGEFTNTGELPVRAHLRGYVTFEGQHVSDLSSSEVLVDPGETVRLKVLLPDLPRAGQYVVTAEVAYSGKVTPSQDVFLVLDPPPAGGTDVPGPSPILIVGVFLVGAAVHARSRHPRKRRQR